MSITSINILLSLSCSVLNVSFSTLDFSFSIYNSWHCLFVSTNSVFRRSISDPTLLLAGSEVVLIVSIKSTAERRCLLVFFGAVMTASPVSTKLTRSVEEELLAEWSAQWPFRFM